MTSYIWNSEEIKKLNYGKVYGHWKSKGLSLDSRDVTVCQLFVAFEGQNVDGHDYIKSALENGASAFIGNFIPRDVDRDQLNCWIVDDVQTALEILASHNRKRLKAKFIAVTGSVGKTSVTNSVAKVLEGFGPTYSTKANYNNEIGLPLCLASMPLDTKYGVFELGMRGFGQIRHLTRFVMPDISIISKISPVHIELLGSLENIAKAKAEIFEFSKPNSVAIYNGDGEYSGILKGVAEQSGIKEIISFGEEDDNDIRLISSKQEKLNHVQVRLFDEEIEYSLVARGKHRAINSLPVLAVVKALGLELNKALKILHSLSELKGRGEIGKIKLDDKEFTLIDESYNSAPDSLRSSLMVLNEFSLESQSGKRIAFLSDMLELGAESEQSHKEIGRFIAKSNIDKVFAFGPAMKNLFLELPDSKKGYYFDSLAEMKLELENLISGEDIVLVKGSFGTKIYEIVELLKRKGSVL